MERNKLFILGCAWVALGATSFCVAEIGVPLKFEEAERRLFPAADNLVGWSQHQISRGGSTYAFSSTTEYDMDGRAVCSSWDSYSRILSGTLVAVPIGDFKVESAFVYRASSGIPCLTGLVVSVEVQLSTGAKTPNEQAMLKTVRDLACVGMALSKGNGGKPMRIMSLKKSACRRFGGKNPRPHYDAPSGKVFILMEDCKLANGDSTFVPATPEGATRGEREKLAKLHRDKDNGGVRVFTSITEIHPVGSSHIHDRIP